MVAIKISSSLRLISLLLWAAAEPSRAASSTLMDVPDGKCSCYLVRGTQETYFREHKFFDFRSMKRHYTGIPNFNTEQRAVRDAGPTSPYFASKEWKDYWQLQTWNNSGPNPERGSTYLLQNSLENVYVDLNTDSQGPDESETYLVLRTAKYEGFSSAAEMQSVDGGHHFGSIRMKARTRGNPGGCTAMFTYRPNSNPRKVQESDIEILTRDPPHAIQYTNQPSYSRAGHTLPEATRNVTIKNRQWSEWHEYRMDWTPEMVSWFVDGNFETSIAFQTPKDPAYVIVNAWTDGSPWTGNMSVGGEAQLQVQWFQIAFNKSDDIGSSPSSKSKREQNAQDCKEICSIDLSGKKGTATLVYSSSAAYPLQGSLIIIALAFCLYGLLLL